ncbi:MAG: methyltransferase [Bdellovibrionales bacterium]
MMDTTTDKLLNSRITVQQPASGYRIAVDTLLLASAVPVQAGQGEKVLELGCGVGGAMLALAARVGDVSITGLELQEPMAALCASNIALNGFEDRLKVEHGDVAAPAHEGAGQFDHVMMNPPFHHGKTHSASANPSKRMANTESEEADLSVWLMRAAQALKQGGCMTMIHRADRQDEIIMLASTSFSTIIIKPIWSKKEGGTCKRIIICALKGEGKDGTSVTIAQPFILYGNDGLYTSDANGILRESGGMQVKAENR